MNEAQIAVLSGVLLLAAIALFVFLGFLWGQRRMRRDGVYVNRDPQQDHDIEIASSRFQEAEAKAAQTEQSITTPPRNEGAAEPTALPARTNPVETTAQQPLSEQSLSEQLLSDQPLSEQFLSDQPMSRTSADLETMSSADLKVKSKLYHYIAHVTDVYDGDTITVDIDMGMGLWQRDMRIRLWRINTSEVRGSERDEGLATRDFVRSIILGRDILLRTILDKRGQDRTGKYGRLLGEVLVEDDSGRMLNVNQLLLEKGLATPIGADGSRSAIPAAAPHPQDHLPDHLQELESVESQQIRAIVCVYCGELRATDPNTKSVALCTNCFDAEYTLSSNVDQSVE